jgi:hypothetical protein
MFYPSRMDRPEELLVMVSSFEKKMCRMNRHQRSCATKNIGGMEIGSISEFERILERGTT